MSEVVEVFTDRVVVVEVPTATSTVVEVHVPGPQGPAGGGGVTEEFVTDAVAAHAIDPTPHPEYDDGPSLVLIFENGLV